MLMEAWGGGVISVNILLISFMDMTKKNPHDNHYPHAPLTREILLLYIIGPFDLLSVFIDQLLRFQTRER